MARQRSTEMATRVLMEALTETPWRYGIVLQSSQPMVHPGTAGDVSSTASFAVESSKNKTYVCYHLFRFERRQALLSTEYILDCLKEGLQT